MVGVELAGALKNVIAIAAGIVDGLGYGHNTVAALITRGLAEITRLAVALGGRADTLAGPGRPGRPGAHLHRRRSRATAALGQALGAGQTPGGGARPTRTMVAEGVRTTLAACALAERAGVEMPIARQMRAVLYEGKPPRDGGGGAHVAEPQKGVD